MRSTLLAVLPAVPLALIALAAEVHAQPAPAPAAHRGFVELGIAYGAVPSSESFVEVDRGAALDSPRYRGAALDLGVGYAVAPNFAIVGDLQHAWATSRTSLDQDGDTATTSFGYTSVGVGARATVPVGPGEVYAQLALAVFLPFETEREERQTDGDGRITTVGWNSGLGARGEMGYHVAITDRMYVAAGLRLQGFGTDNAGRERVRRDLPGGQIEREVYSTNPDAANALEAEALAVQDLRLRLGFGLRF